MTDIGPGTELEFIGPLDGNEGDHALMIGAIYIVHHVAFDPIGCDRCDNMTFVALTIHTGWIYCPCVFRPISDGQERIERKAVKRVCEDA